MKLSLGLKWTDPFVFHYRRYYHLWLLVVWLIRYSEYILTATLGNALIESTLVKYSVYVKPLPLRVNELSYRTFGEEISDDILLGAFVVLFITAWAYRSFDTRLRDHPAVYITLGVELFFEMGLVVFYLMHLWHLCASNLFSFGRCFWHIVWMLHLLLVIYKLLCVFLLLVISHRKKDERGRHLLYLSIIGMEERAEPVASTDHFSGNSLGAGGITSFQPTKQPSANSPAQSAAPTIALCPKVLPESGRISNDLHETGIAQGDLSIGFGIGIEQCVPVASAPSSISISPANLLRTPRSSNH